MKKKVEYRPIGIIHTPFKEPKGTPIQPRAGKGIEGVVEVFAEYVPALSDLEKFSHIILIYHLHRTKSYQLKVVPFMDDKLRGLFATRAPARPNPIGISVVRLKRIETNRLYIQDLDIVDQTPLLDIKPYVPEFDRGEKIKFGWLESRIHRLEESRDDGRFVTPDEK
ncbi:tRNA (N6-threonylcarbamoyladenosine(37)-N6)-methyltransferase TrmO [candidate division WOR-3 bacterium 4484_100]|uniref:tRNA (N6-threonylcarbamoyladenosine(37)-N6)-methyltransferase TrmO n=1 Tax=candidate division WOR-3 bacterium 4484_100 TaxID=1936077 RepID=A0A1V4QFA4_UNCW3|nr:MAG: tRNA (N6-threonylcarbamoyladenosine(37)-N6)-methyltransferase TrmO [candidate division WOR-3 bacterium 4484_100]